MKKLNRLSTIIALILIAAFIFPSTAVVAAANNNNLVYFYGDLNANGGIDKFDYLLIKRSCMNTISLTDEQKLRGDVNGNGDIDKFDYILVKRHVMSTYTIPMVTLCEHELERINAKDATCDENGNIAYFYCGKCEKCYSDAEATNEITLESTVIAAKGHDYTVYKYDVFSHWKECACGKKSETIAHTYTDVVTPPTDSEQGFTTHTCNECGRSYTDSYVKPTASVGLAYTVNDDGITCTVTGIGTCSDSDLIIPSKIDGYTVTSIGFKAFYDCKEFRSVTLPDSITSLDVFAFFGCTGLTSIVLPDNVTSINEGALQNCTGLTNVTIPVSVTFISNWAFAGCYALKDVYYTGSQEEWEQLYIDSMTNSELTSATIHYNCKIASSGLSYDANEDGITCTITGIGTCSDSDLIIPSEINGYKVTTIGKKAFYECYALTSIVLPDSVTSIGDDAFYWCHNLKDVYYQGNVENWLSIQFAGHYSNPCYSGANLYFNDVLVTELVIPDSVTSIGDFAFEGCASLTSITIPDSVTSIGDFAFDNCDNLVSITIPDSVTSIGYGAFAHCTSLPSITIPDSVTSIGDDAFFGCSSLKYNLYDNAYYLGNANNPYVVLVQAISEDITSCTINPNTKLIYSYAFCSCTSLTSINIPDSVTSIGNSAFEGCDNLKNVTIGNSVASIDDFAFNACSNLKDVYYAGSQEEWEQIEIGSGNSDLTSATIHYNSK